MPKGFLTEAGPQPELAELYGAHELDTAAYRTRTVTNVEDADGTLWFGDTDSPGGCLTLGLCQRMGMPFMVMPLEGLAVRPSQVAQWLHQHQVEVLNVAGNRESSEPGIGQRVEAFLKRVFVFLVHGDDRADTSDL